MNELNIDEPAEWKTRILRQKHTIQLIQSEWAESRASTYGVQTQREQREAGAANYCPFSGEGRFVYIGKLLKVHISPEAYSLNLRLNETVCIIRFLFSFFHE